MESISMAASVKEVRCHSLIVRNVRTAEEIVVHTNDSFRFFCGDIVCIRYNGIMTRSIPPQITASCITLVKRG